MARNIRPRPVLLGIAILLGFCFQSSKSHAMEIEEITVAGGCFWCVEADFEKVEGVIEAVSGFTGGTVENPSYKQVVRGGTGHVEAVRISYDPTSISVDELYALFFRSVDPTDDGGQFCDRGPTYRTAIFAEGDARRAAEKAKSVAESELGQSIVTPILAPGAFYPADDYHQDYYKKRDLIITRFGPLTKAKAYKRYRTACKRDERIRALWGPDAPFIGG